MCLSYDFRTRSRSYEYDAAANLEGVYTSTRRDGKRGGSMRVFCAFG